MKIINKGRQFVIRQNDNWINDTIQNDFKLNDILPIFSDTLFNSFEIIFIMGVLDLLRIREETDCYKFKSSKKKFQQLPSFSE